MPLNTYQPSDFDPEAAPAEADTQAEDTPEPEEDQDATDPNVDPETGLPWEELRRGYMRQSDYSKKRAEEAARVRAAEQELNDAKRQLAQYGPTKQALDELIAIAQANPDAEAEISAILARHGKAMPSLPNPNAELQKRLDALESRYKEDQESRNAELVEDGTRYLMKRYNISKKEATKVIFRMGDEDAPILPKKATATAFRKAADAAYRDLFFDQARTKGQEALLGTNARAKKAATAGGGNTPPPSPPPARPRSWDEAEEIALKQIKGR